MADENEDGPDAGIYIREGAADLRPALAGTRRDVAMVIDTMRQNDNSIEATASYLTLSVAQVETALLYYQQHREEIDSWIAARNAENEAAYKRAQEDRQPRRDCHPTLSTSGSRAR